MSTDAPSTASADFRDSVAALQLDAALLLHAIIAQGSGLTPSLLRFVEVGLVSRIFSCIHSANLDIQGQLLLTLHEVIRLASLSPQASATRKSSSSQDYGKSDESLVPSDQATSVLLQTLVDGLSTSSNLPVLPEWSAFITRTVPLFRGPTRALLSPLSDCLVGRVARISDSLRLRLDLTDTATSMSTGLPSDLEVTAYLEILELVASLAYRASADAKEQGSRSRSDSSAGLRGYVVGVSVGDGQSEEGSSNGGGAVSTLLSYRGQLSKADTSILDQNITSGVRSLIKAVRALHALWQAADAGAVKEGRIIADGLGALCRTTRAHSANVLGQLYRLEPVGVVQTLAEIWASHGGSSSVSSGHGHRTSTAVANCLNHPIRRHLNYSTPSPPARRAPSQVSAECSHLERRRLATRALLV